MGKKIGIGCIIAFVIVIVIIGLGSAAYIISSRNNMVAKEVAIQEAWAQVQNVYQRRLDLVPNLAESAKAYLQLEKDIFETIADARRGIENAETPAELESVSREVGSFIDDFKVIVEDTPELRASETVRDLMTQLEGTENRIAVERSRFNEVVSDYNKYIRMFPRNLLAPRFGFEERDTEESGQITIT